MKNIKILTVLLTTFVALSSFSNSKFSSWTILGSKTVALHGDHDELYVTGAKGTFTKLKFQVTSAPVYVRNVKVVYRNGTSENHKVNQRFNKGQSSRVLDLKGSKRIIHKIVFNYDTINNGNGRAKVIAFGRH